MNTNFNTITFESDVSMSPTALDLLYKAQELSTSNAVLDRFENLSAHDCARPSFSPESLFHKFTNSRGQESTGTCSIDKIFSEQRQQQRLMSQPQQQPYGCGARSTTGIPNAAASPSPSPHTLHDVPRLISDLYSTSYVKSRNIDALRAEVDASLYPLGTDTGSSGVRTAATATKHNTSTSGKIQASFDIDAILEKIIPLVPPYHDESMSDDESESDSDDDEEDDEEMPLATIPDEPAGIDIGGFESSITDENIDHEPSQPRDNSSQASNQASSSSEQNNEPAVPNRANTDIVDITTASKTINRNDCYISMFSHEQYVPLYDMRNISSKRSVAFGHDISEYRKERDGSFYPYVYTHNQEYVIFVDCDFVVTKDTDIEIVIKDAQGNEYTQINGHIILDHTLILDGHGEEIKSEAIEGDVDRANRDLAHYLSLIHPNTAANPGQNWAQNHTFVIVRFKLSSVFAPNLLKIEFSIGNSSVESSSFLLRSNPPKKDKPQKTGSGSKAAAAAAAPSGIKKQNKTSKNASKNKKQNFLS